MKVHGDKIELVTATACVIGGLYMFYETGFFKASASVSGAPAVFPRLALGLGIGAAILTIIRKLRELRQTSAMAVAPVDIELKALVFLVVLTVVYIVVADMAGFEIPTVIYLYLLIYQRMREYWRPALIALVASIAIYVVFVLLLQIRLPLLFLPEYASELLPWLKGL
ncbi:MAG TPA: tripartite tricarboxylate transporter TctB family protein [Burkholderiales bacterium]|jgi:hypothetical protein|nr:tripartite tricarboxylate transporter TctB family protein [Burkholderiales bacterium]